MGSKSGNVQGGSNDPEAKNFPFSKEGDSSLKQQKNKWCIFDQNDAKYGIQGLKRKKLKIL